jgi:hypothetical protein
MLLAAAVVQLAILPAAMACEGQPGAVIFTDNFADDSGGWDFGTSGIKVVPPVMQLVPNAQNLGLSSQNLTFNATDGDYCADFTAPAQVGDNKVGYGIEFWATDYSNMMLFLVQSNKTASLYKRVAGTWGVVVDSAPAATLNVGADAANTLRVQSLAGKLTLSVNGAVVKVIRAQVPAGQLRFGVFGEFDSAPATPQTIAVTDFSLTAGQ